MEIRPNLKQGEHPVYSGKYKIITSEIENTAYYLKQCINSRVEGVIIYGASGQGKTTAIEMISHILNKEYNSKLPVVSCTLPDDLKDKNTFFSNILQGLNHTLSGGKTTNQNLRDRIVASLITKGKESETNRIIMFIDEADGMQAKEYQALKNIHNLVTPHCTLMTILVGTKKILGVREGFIVAHEDQLIRRFMRKHKEFYGIKSLQDLYEVLSAYDIICKYPLDSDWAFTRYFYPDAFDKGNRLSDNTEILYDLILSSQGADAFSNSGFSMYLLTIIIEYILTCFGADNQGIYWPGENEWREAIDFTMQ